ncbi:sulfite exporter TauE/SafE family protein [Clostridium sp. WLY-B-L2]|uniref:Probable membrane transporter protein n=1 Tax=Clostridium aromativorans TaxID=2836848 RepID=A0ABS8N3W3_9CLOT|nr:MULTISPECIES: sulfite exporter TauE/SafE family protein [Clostridium]KAA8667872.1 sulfite exporter TauE/SafE family protein [Clostridium sp. HV4-5-A1G]MCC9294477.1 sulfite exporter TauE/SafE family protein [Clostridium aromativorans]CAB1255078.1 putative integral inner membrane protein [Clostridiaceae bacterium BL-3]
MTLEIIVVMFITGAILGFVGAGGSGFIISILTVIFHYPIHTSLGTALAAMIFSSISGSLSHYKEGNAVLKVGIAVGLFGAIGAWTSSNFSYFIPADKLKWITSGMLYLSAVVLWIRMFIVSRNYANIDKSGDLPHGVKFWISCGSIGLITGAISGMCGIGSASFIQIGLMFILGMSIRESAGTTMMVIVPIALAGGAGYYHLGYLNIHLLIEVVAGTMMGSYIGAKLTRRVPVPILKTAMILVPITAGTLLLF